MFEKVLAAMLLVLQFAAAEDPDPSGPMGIYSANQKIG